MTRDTLDELLDRSAPATRAAEPDALRAMVAEARRAAVPRRVRRRSAAIALGIGIAALLAGGAGVAVAGDLLWTGWVKEPTATYSYALPSGATCTVMVGDFTSPDPEVRAVVEEFYREDVMSRVDVEGAIAELRADPPIAELEDGTTERIEPGSKHYEADWEYKTAVRAAVGDALVDYLREKGHSAPQHTAHGEELCSNDAPVGDR